MNPLPWSGKQVLIEALQQASFYISLVTTALHDYPSTHGVLISECLAFQYFSGAHYRIVPLEMGVELANSQCLLHGEVETKAYCTYILFEKNLRNLQSNLLVGWSWGRLVCWNRHVLWHWKMRFRIIAVGCGRGSWIREHKKIMSRVIILTLKSSIISSQTAIYKPL